MKQYIIGGLAALTLSLANGCTTNRVDCVKDLRTEYKQMMNRSEIDPAQKMQYEQNMINCERKIKKEQDDSNDQLVWYIILS